MSGATLLGYFHQAEPRQTCSNKQNPGRIFRCCGNRALKTRRYGPFLLDLALYLRVLRVRGWWQPVPHPVKIPFLACGMGLSPDGVSCALRLSGCSSRRGPVPLVLDGTFAGCGGNRHDGDPVIARRPPVGGELSRSDWGGQTCCRTQKARRNQCEYWFRRAFALSANARQTLRAYAITGCPARPWRWRP